VPLVVVRLQANAPERIAVEVTTDPIPDPVAHSVRTTVTLPRVAPPRLSDEVAAAPHAAATAGAVQHGPGAALRELSGAPSGAGSGSAQALFEISAMAGATCAAAFSAAQGIVVGTPPDLDGRGSVSTVDVPLSVLPLHLATPAAGSDAASAPGAVTWRALFQADVAEQFAGEGAPALHVPVGASAGGDPAACSRITGLRIVMTGVHPKLAGEAGTLPGLDAVQLLTPDPSRTHAPALSVLRDLQETLHACARSLRAPEPATAGAGAGVSAGLAAAAADAASGYAAETALAASLRIGMASASQAALLRYCDALLEPPSTVWSRARGQPGHAALAELSSSAADHTPPAVSHYEGEITSAAHRAAVAGALRELKEARLEAVRAALLGIAARQPGHRREGVVDLRWDPAASSKDIVFSAENRAAASKPATSINTMAVAETGFSAGRTVVQIKLVKDNQGGECTCFGFVDKKPPADYNCE